MGTLGQGGLDRGQAVPAVIGVVAVLAAVAVGVARFGTGVSDAARARTAADAAALAGVDGGAANAAELAAANGGTLVSFRQEGDDVVVSVVVGHTHAEARATDGP
jgi:hypothetical protein